MLKQPVNQVRLTNVAVVRLKRNGKRFEVACFKNKILNWRSGAELDIAEVLQTEAIFQNVSKGHLAKANELTQVFGTRDMTKIAREILERGELQISQQERDSSADALFKDICTLVAARVFNARTGLPIPVTMIQEALAGYGFSTTIGLNQKRQCLKAVELLCSSNPEEICRQQMKLRLLVRQSQAGTVVSFLRSSCLAAIISTTNSSLDQQQLVFSDSSSALPVDSSDAVRSVGLEAKGEDSKDRTAAAHPSTPKGPLLNSVVSEASSRSPIPLSDANGGQGGYEKATDSRGQHESSCSRDVPEVVQIAGNQSANTSPRTSGSLEHMDGKHEDATCEISFLCNPTHYRAIDTFSSVELQPPGSLQLLSLNQCIVNLEEQRKLIEQKDKCAAKGPGPHSSKRNHVENRLPPQNVSQSTSKSRAKRL